MRNLNFVYVYGCGTREDGMRYAIGTHLDGRTDGSVALFKSGLYAHAFAATLASELECGLNILPSAEIGPDGAPLNP